MFWDSGPEPSHSPGARITTSHSGGRGRGGTEQLLSRSCNSFIHPFIHSRHWKVSVNPSPCNSKCYSEKRLVLNPQQIDLLKE